jgi:hypothetical protein
VWSLPAEGLALAVGCPNIVPVLFGDGTPTTDPSGALELITSGFSGCSGRSANPVPIIDSATRPMPTDDKAPTVHAAVLTTTDRGLGMSASWHLAG